MLRKVVVGRYLAFADRLIECESSDNQKHSINGSVLYM